MAGEPTWIQEMIMKEKFDKTAPAHLNIFYSEVTETHEGQLAVKAMHIDGQHHRESTWTKDKGGASEGSSDYVSYLTAPVSFVTGQAASFVTAPLTYLWGSSHSLSSSSS